MIRSKLKDFLFAKCFIINEMDDATALEKEVVIVPAGEPDQVTNSNIRLEIHNPTSITKCIFSVLNSLIHSDAQTQIDHAILSIMFMCKEYVYADFTHEKRKGPPVLISPYKLPIVKFIVKDVLEPIVKKVELRPILFMPCRFTDTCRWIESEEQLTKQYQFPKYSFGNYDFPILLSNSAIHNQAAVMSDLIVKTLEHSFGHEKAHGVIKEIMLDQNGELLDDIILILKTINGEPEFVLDFIDYLSCHVQTDFNETAIWNDIHERRVGQANLFMHKTSTDNYTQAVQKQWSQWSMLMGLTEKQLTPARGSMWPTTENLKPHDQRLRRLFLETAKRKNKRQLNFADMLESARKMYNHTATEPGVLIEELLKENRAWKV